MAKCLRIKMCRPRRRLSRPQHRHLRCLRRKWSTTCWRWMTTWRIFEVLLLLARDLLFRGERCNVPLDAIRFLMLLARVTLIDSFAHAFEKFLLSSHLSLLCPIRIAFLLHSLLLLFCLFSITVLHDRQRIDMVVATDAACLSCRVARWNCLSSFCLVRFFGNVSFRRCSSGAPSRMSAEHRHIYFDRFLHLLA